MAPRGTKPPYTAVADIQTFFDRLRNIGPPPKVDTAWIKAMSLASVQPEGVPGMIKWLGIADKSGVPNTEVWNKVRIPGTRQETLQELVKAGYAKVFEHVDVEHGTRQDIEGAFISAYGVGHPQRTVTTFLAICEVAGLAVDGARQSPAPSTTPNPKPNAAKPKPKAAKPKPPKPQAAENNAASGQQGINAGDRPAISISLNVEIPADCDEQQIRDRVAVVTKAAQGG